MAETNVESPQTMMNTVPETLISADARQTLLQSLRDLWNYRDLFFAFVRRDIMVRYRQTALGVAWVLLQPLIAGGLFAAVFSRLGAMQETSALDALLFFLAGLVPWTSFASAVTSASTSLETNANLIGKVYFPRAVVPAAFVLGSGIDFAIGFTVLLVIAAAAGKFSFWLVVAVVPLLIIQMMTAMGLGLFFSILDAQYRDVKYVVPVLLNIGMLVTVLMSLDRWGQPWAGFLSFNPMASVVETWRAVLAGGFPDWLLLAKGTAMAALMLVVGVHVFRARETRLVDVL